MGKNIKIIKSQPFLKEWTDFQCGKTKFAILSSKDMEIPQEDTRPHEEYSKHENFPNCCDYHKSIFQIGLKLLDKFPDCCEGHKKLVGQSWFKKENYNYLPRKLVITVTDTYYCAIQSFDKPDWFNIITNYIEYVRYSYGQFPDGFGSPLGLGPYLDNTKSAIQSIEAVSKFKRDRIINYIDDTLNYSPPINQTSLSELVEMYHKWLNSFPFELPFFRELKPSFANQLPILDGKPEFNKFMGVGRAKLISPDKLIKSLEVTTNNLVSQINSLELFEKGLLTGPKKLQFDLIIQERRLKLNQGYNTDADPANGYRKILSEWMRDEIDFIEKIKPYLPIAKESSSGTHRENIIAHQFKVKARYCDDKTASDWKNERGDKGYQAYYTTLKQSKRYKEYTISELTVVIELLQDFPLAQKLAMTEIEKLQSL